MSYPWNDCHFSQSVTEGSLFLSFQELGATPSKTKLKASSPKEKAGRPGAKVSVFISQKSSMPRTSLSPPTRDTGPRQFEGGKQAPLSQEIHKLQNELEVYIQKVEELANRGDSQKQLVTLCPCLTVDYMFHGTT